MAQANDNFVEGLKKLLGPVSQLMMLPDADVDYLTNLQLVIRNKVMGAYMSAAQLGPSASAGGPPMPGSVMSQDGAVPSLGLGPGAPTPMGPGGGIGGGSGGIAPPNADELRRVLAAGAGA